MFNTNFIRSCQAFLLMVALLTAAHSAAALTIPYGKSGKIVYDMEHGKFDIYKEGTLLIGAAEAAFNLKDQLIRSGDYSLRKYTRLKIQDGFGKGEKHIITLSKNGLPELRQVFYVYNGKAYLMCAVEIEGEGLAINRIVAVQGTLGPLARPAEMNNLFVPFDNDTFIRYESPLLKAGNTKVSAEVGALYDNVTREGLICGSVEHELWKTGILFYQSDKNIALKAEVGYTEKGLTRDELPHGFVKGKIVKSPRIFIGAYGDWRSGMEEYGKANTLAEPTFVGKWTKPTPVGWNSWGQMQEHISFDKTIKTVDFFADSLQQFRNEGIAYIDLDSYWDKLIRGGLEGDYSELKKFADYAHKRGLKPGVYWAPFVDWGFSGGADRRAEGSDYKFGEMWTKVGNGFHDIDGARALDPTHPGTRKRIELVTGKLKECGFEMIKIDFLGHAAVESDHFYDPSVMTGMQAYQSGMEYLIKQLDGKMMIYAAISPSMASGRYVHVRRIACDAFRSISDTKYTLNSVTYGWWQTYLYDYVDGDHVVLSHEQEGPNRARFLSAITTGTVIVGDDFSIPGPWAAKAKSLFQNRDILEIIKDGKAFSPVEHSEYASSIFIKHKKSVSYLSLFNYDKQSSRLSLSAARLGLDAGKTYIFEDLFTHTKTAFKDQIFLSIPQEDAFIFKITEKK